MGKSKLVLSLLLLFTLNSLPVAEGQDNNRFPLPALEPISAENARNLTHLGTLEGFSFWTLFSAFSPDDRFVAATGHFNGARIWDVQSGELLAHLECPKANLDGWTGGISFSPDGALLAAACGSSVFLWDMTSVLQEAAPQPVTILQVEINELLGSVVIDNTGRYLAVQNNNRRYGFVWLWDIHTGEQLAVYRHASAVCCLNFDSAGELLAYADGVGTHIWDMETLQEVSTLTSRRLAFNPIWTLTVETDLAYGGALQTGDLRLENTQADQPTAILLHTNNYLPSELDFSPDSTLLGYGSVEGRNMLIWDTESHEQLADIQAVGISSLNFSHNGKLIVTTHATAGGPQGQVELWGVPSS